MNNDPLIETETESTTRTTPRNINAAIVLVAICPIPGKSKTRLAKDERLGKDGAADLARAMLSDVLDRVGRCVSIDFCINTYIF